MRPSCYHQKSVQVEIWDLDSFLKTNVSVKSSGVTVLQARSLKLNKKTNKNKKPKKKKNAYVVEPEFLSPDLTKIERN